MIDLTNKNYDELNVKYSNILEHLPHDKNKFLHIVDTGIKYINEKYGIVNVNQKAGTVILLRRWFNDNDLIDDNSIFNIVDDYYIFYKNNNKNINDITMTKNLDMVTDYMKIKNTIK